MEDLKGDKIQPIIEVSRKRWVILIIYILCTCLSTAQWIEYSIITNVVMKYYHVRATTIDWTSMSFSIIWPILVFPASFIIDKAGLRVAVLIGILSTALGAGIKVLSVGENLFYVVFLGQMIVSISQTFLLNLPSKLSIAWFKPEEISTVCSLGILGMTSGTAISYFVPPIIVKDSDNMDEIAADLVVMCWSIFLVSIPLVLIVFFYFPERPVNPPSTAVFEERNNKPVVTISVFVTSIKNLMKNKAFHVQNIAFGCNFAIYSSIGTLLNQFILNYFPGAQEDAGRMGSLMIIAGIGGSLFTGFILDKTHKFKETSVILFILGAIGLGGVLYALSSQNKWLSYLAITVFGIFLSAYLPAGVEFATELTYPLPESTVMGFLYASSQVMTFILTLIFGQVTVKYGTFWSLTGMIVTMVLGSVLTMLTPNKLRRQAFFKLNNGTKFTQIPQEDNMNFAQRVVL